MDDNQSTLASLQDLNRQYLSGCQNSISNLPQVPWQVADGSQDARFVILNEKLDRIIRLLENRYEQV